MENKWVQFIEWDHPTRGLCLCLEVSGVLESGRKVIVLEYDADVWSARLSLQELNRTTLNALLDDPKATGLVEIV